MKVVISYYENYPQVALHYTLGAISQMKDAEIIILTDTVVKGFENIKLPNYHYPTSGCWQKLELFSHPELGRILYVDMDFMFLTDLNVFWDYETDKPFIADGRPYPDGKKRDDIYCSGLFRIDLDKYRHVGEAFQREKEKGLRTEINDEKWMYMQHLPWTPWPYPWIRYCRWGTCTEWFKDDVKALHFNGERKWWRYLV